MLIMIFQDTGFVIILTNSEKFVCFDGKIKKLTLSPLIPGNPRAPGIPTGPWSKNIQKNRISRILLLVKLLKLENLIKLKHEEALVVVIDSFALFLFCSFVCSCLLFSSGV